MYVASAKYATALESASVTQTREQLVKFDVIRFFILARLVFNAVSYAVSPDSVMARPSPVAETKMISVIVSLSIEGSLTAFAISVSNVFACPVYATKPTPPSVFYIHFQTCRQVDP